MNLTRYDAMCKAIEECESVDEVKSIRDKALEAHDHAQLKSVRRHMHSLNRKLRAASA